MGDRVGDLHPHYQGREEVTVQVGDKYRTKSGRIAYEVLAIHGSSAWLKLIKHPFGVNEDDYGTEPLESLERLYEKVEPFFEVGKKYCSPRTFSAVPWEILMVSERGGERAAWATRKIGASIEWTTLRDFEYFEEVAD